MRRLRARVDESRLADAELASGGYGGPLHGIPMGVKDNKGLDVIACLWRTRA